MARPYYTRPHSASLSLQHDFSALAVVMLMTFGATVNAKTRTQTQYKIIRHFIVAASYQRQEDGRILWELMLYIDAMILEKWYFAIIDFATTAWASRLLRRHIGGRKSMIEAWWLTIASIVGGRAQIGRLLAWNKLTLIDNRQLMSRACWRWYPLRWNHRANTWWNIACSAFSTIKHLIEAVASLCVAHGKWQSLFKSK